MADSQNATLNRKIVGGGCDGCSLIYEGMPQNLIASDTGMAWNSKAPKLIIEGTVFKSDSHTPASGVIIYYWHTDASGRYPTLDATGKKATRHGSIRGWMKTNNEGKFTLHTGRPAAYPASDIPAHIHFVVKESNLNEYYTDELVFDDDPLLTQAKKEKMENRGGSGIIKTKFADGKLSGKHTIILGLNVPDYPGNMK